MTVHLWTKDGDYVGQIGVHHGSAEMSEHDQRETVPRPGGGS